MRNFFPVARINLGTADFTVLSDNEGNFLVQDAQTLITSVTEDVWDITDLLATHLEQFIPHVTDNWQAEAAVEAAEDAPATPGDAYIAAQESSRTPQPIFEWDVANSSLIKRVAYFDSGTCEVELMSGDVYHYDDVPEALVCTDWTYADSAGKFYNQYIRGQYDSIKVA